MDTLVHIQSHIVKEWFPGCLITSENDFVLYNFKVPACPEWWWPFGSVKHLLQMTYRMSLVYAYRASNDLYFWLGQPPQNEQGLFIPTKTAGAPFGYPRCWNKKLPNLLGLWDSGRHATQETLLLLYDLHPSNSAHQILIIKSQQWKKDHLVF